MFVTKISVVTLLLVCLVSSVACAAGPGSFFEVSVVAAGDSIWEYTLKNNGDEDADPVAWTLNLNWVDDWSNSQPEPTFTVEGYPDDWDWNSGQTHYVAFNNQDINPGPGQELPGFKVGSATPATHFWIYYDYYSNEEGQWGLYDGDQYGTVTVPEPGSLTAIFTGLVSLCGFIKRRTA